jgi:predicted dienelactone hydrolase
LPLFIWSHGSGSDRREGTKSCTHLASHGYVVAALDHIGDTILEPPLATTYAQVPAAFKKNCTNRVADVSLVIDQLIAGAEPTLNGLIDATQIGIGGASYGGWTSIAVNSRDRRPRAVFALAPGWGQGPLHTELMTAQARLDDWGRPVAAFVLAGEKDSCVPLPGIRQLYRDLQGPKRFAVLANASHFHGHDEAKQRYEMARMGWRAVAEARMPDPAFDFASILANSPDFSELLPNETAVTVIQSLVLAHADEILKGNAEAGAFLDSNLERTYRARGIELKEVASENAFATA